MLKTYLSVKSEKWAEKTRKKSTVNAALYFRLWWCQRIKRAQPQPDGL
jgi:hypothetical protein